MIRTLIAAFALTLPAAAQADCGPDAPCEIDGGSYHLMTPPDWDGKTALPALVFFHGHRGNGASIFRSAGLKGSFSDKGYLIIAPNGPIRPVEDYRFWPARPGAGPRDDVAFTLSVLDDVADRLPLDEDRVFVSGFSAGGSMAWMMGCYAGDRFAGVASVAGALRRPVPVGECPNPAPRHIQIHGFTDGQVPLEGRAIGDWHQGDVFESLGLLRASNKCRSNPDTLKIGKPFSCRVWTSCDVGKQALCLHDGGHELPKGWTDLAREFLEG